MGPFKNCIHKSFEFFLDVFSKLTNTVINSSIYAYARHAWLLLKPPTTTSKKWRTVLIYGKIYWVCNTPFP